MSVVNVDDILDVAPMRGLQTLVAACVTTVLVLDGLDVIVISLVAPALASEFSVARKSLGSVLAAALVGMALGALISGPAGDRWGRRPLLLVSTALFSLATLLTITSSSLFALTFWRFLTGLGLGGAVPNAVAMLAEHLSRRWRNQSIAVAIVGVPIGGMLGAWIAPAIIPTYGWRAMFIIGGILPIIAILLTYFALPESPRYLATRHDRQRELALLLNRIVGAETYSAADQFTLRIRTARARVSLLFSRKLLLDTIGVWLIFFSNLFSVFTFLSWTPLILTSLGLPFAVAMRGLLVFNLAGIVGGILTAWVIAPFGSRWPTITLALLASSALVFVSRLLVGTGIPEVAPLMTGFACAGFALVGIQVAAYSLSAHVYPTEIRASGVGWAAVTGRVGSIVSTIVSGAAFAWLKGPGLFAALAAIASLTLLGAVLVRGHMRTYQP
jgi:AAHS family 4-hydroxybenzoate transporter-like MFS transporter